MVQQKRRLETSFSDKRLYAFSVFEMSVAQNAYLTYMYDYTQPSDYDSTKGFILTEPVGLPDWFTNASPKYKRVIRVLGVTAGYFDPTTGLEPDEMQKGIRVFGNLTKDFPSNGFVMMINNYNSVKEFDITNHNIRELTWWLTDAVGTIFPSVGIHVDLVIEVEIMIVEDS